MSVQVKQKAERCATNLKSGLGLDLFESTSYPSKNLHVYVKVYLLSFFLSFFPSTLPGKKVINDRLILGAPPPDSTWFKGLSLLLITWGASKSEHWRD